MRSFSSASRATSRLPHLLLLVAFGCLMACDASFTDLRESSVLGDSGAAMDAGLDAAIDANVEEDASQGVDATPDVGEMPDASESPSGSIRGTFSGSSGYTASGSVTMMRDSVRLGDDFRVDPGPGLILVLSPRASLGRAVDPETDLNLGEIPGTSGAAEFSFDAIDLPESYFAHIYCEPFGVGFAVAEMN